MTRINLIPPEMLERRAIRTRCQLWGRRLGLLTAILTVFYLGILHVASGSSTEIQAMAARYSRLQERMRQAERSIEPRR